MRLIDKRCAIKQLKKLLKNNIMPTEWYEGAKSAITLLQKEPTVDAEPVRYGKWLDADDGIGCTCSICGYDAWTDTPFCPNCGAKMDETEERLVMPPADGSTIKIGKMDEVEDG